MSNHSAIPPSPTFSGVSLTWIVVASALFFRSSEGRLSAPGYFPAFRLRTASSISSLSTGRLSAFCAGIWLLWSRLVSGCMPLHSVISPLV